METLIKACCFRHGWAMISFWPSVLCSLTLLYLPGETLAQAQPPGQSREHECRSLLPPDMGAAGNPQKRAPIYYQQAKGQALPRRKPESLDPFDPLAPLERRADPLGGDYFDEGRILERMREEIEGCNRPKREGSGAAAEKDGEGWQQRVSQRAGSKTLRVEFLLANGISYRASFDFSEQGILLKQRPRDDSLNDSPKAASPADAARQFLEEPGIAYYIPFDRIERLEFHDWEPRFTRTIPGSLAKERYWLPGRARVMTREGYDISGDIESLKWIQLNISQDEKRARAERMETVLRTYFKRRENNAPAAPSPPPAVLQTLIFLGDSETEREGILSQR